MSDEENVDPSASVELAPGTALLVWRGVAVTVPAELDDLDPDAIEALENGKAITALRLIFGSKEYDGLRDEFEKQHGFRPKVRDLTELTDQVGEHFGFENAGE